MTPAASEEAVFAEAIRCSTPECRAAYLSSACGANSALRQRVEALLRASEQAGDFLERPPTGLGGTGESSLPAGELSEGPGDRIGRYKLLERIGEGGCGVVYMAEQEVPVRRRVALKIIKLGMDTRSVIARFEAERQALALMDHPNIAKVLDGGATQTGRPYFVMELVRGVRVTEYCDEAGLSTEARLRLFVQICHAVQHAHQKGVIHRDLKPANLLVTVNDGAPVPKVIDFGIAKATGQRLTDKTLFTQFHSFIGTPAYVSPEQAEMSSVDIDTRSDIYSLGVLLYELLTGKTPFDGEELLRSGLDAMRRTIRDQQPPTPSARLTEELGRVGAAADKGAVAPSIAASHPLPRGEEEKAAAVRVSSRQRLSTRELISAVRGDLDWIVMKCLEKDRSRRYETANGLASDILRHLHCQAVLARPASVAYRFQRLVQRNKLAFAAVTAVAAALVIGLGAATVMFFRERLARTGEQRQRREAQSAQKVAETERERANAQARKASESQQQSRALLYASDMNLAQQAFKMNNLGRARRLLERHRPRSGEEDLRGWEWRYLWQLTRSSALVTLTNRPARGLSVSFSPDGARLAVGWYDGRVELWDVPGRRRLRGLTDREYSHQGRVAFSPVRNLLAATSEPKVVTLYDLDANRESVLWRGPDTGRWIVRELSFSQDGSRVVIYAANPIQTTGSAPQSGDEVHIVNVSSARIESRHPALHSKTFHGGAQLSPSNRRLYLARSDVLNYRYSIQCIDLATDQNLWESVPERDLGLTTLAISPDGRVLASGSGYEDPTIRVWDAATGRLLNRLDGHAGLVFKLSFSRDGRRLISAAADHSIRIWDTSTWTETQVLRGHTDEVCAVAFSEAAQLIASVSKDGDLKLWKADGESATDGYRRLPENLRAHQVLPLDDSRVLLLPPGHPPELVDLKRDSAALSLPELGDSTNVLGWSGTNLLCRWNGTNQIIVHQWRGSAFTWHGAVTLDSGARPAGAAYHARRHLLAWSESSSTAVYLANLAAPGRRIELKNDVPRLTAFRFSEDGDYLVALTKGLDYLGAWNVETGQPVASSNRPIRDTAFAGGGRVLVVTIEPEPGHRFEIRFYNLADPDRAPDQLSWRDGGGALAVSPDGALVALSADGGQVRLFDLAKGEWAEDLHGHLSGVHSVAFSPDGRRLISAALGGRESVKVWDVGTRQELLTLGGTGDFLTVARWSADGDVILAGPPWQAWRVPSFEDIPDAMKDGAEYLMPRKP